MNRRMIGDSILRVAVMLATVAMWCGVAAADDINPHHAKPGVDSLGDPLPSGALLRFGTQRFHHPSPVIELAVSPDEKSIVTIDDNHLIVWDAATGKMQWRANPRELGIALPGAAYGIRALAFAANSSRFYTPGRHGQIIVWDVASGNHEVLSLSETGPNNNKVDPVGDADESDGGFPKAIDVTKDGRRFALGSSRGVVVCDEKGKERFKIANAPETPIANGGDSDDRLMFGGDYSVGRFSPDEKLLAVVASDSPETIRLCDAESGKDLRRITLKSKLVRFAFSPDGRRIVTTERDVAARMYDVESGAVIWSTEIPPAVRAESYLSAVAFCPDPNVIAVGAPIGADESIRLLDARTGKEVGKLMGHTWKPWALAAGSKVLYSSGWDGAVRRWDVDQRKQLPLPVGLRATSVVTISPDGRLLAYGDDSGTIHLVRASDGRELSTIDFASRALTVLTFSPDSRRLAGGGASGDQVRVAVWEAADGKMVRDWKWPKGRDVHSDVESLCFRPDGQQLAAAVFRQSAAYLWDLNSGDQVAQLKHGEVYGLSFSPDGKTLATVGWDNILRFWETTAGELQREVDVSEGRGDQDDHRMYTVCYSPAGGVLATAHLDGKVRIWNVADMEMRKEFRVPGGFIFGSICFSPDGSLLATGSAGSSINLWDPMTAELVWRVGRHESYVYTVRFGADRKTLVSGGSDGVCYVWDLQPHGQPPEEDLNALWKNLARDGAAAYLATWKMAETPERTVTFLSNKLRQINKVMDLDRIAKGVSEEEATERQRLARVLAEKNERVALTYVIRRAVTLLSQLNTADARRLLKELAERDPDGELGRMSAAALKATLVP